MSLVTPRLLPAGDLGEKIVPLTAYMTQFMPCQRHAE
ncbi:MAG: hypothetical protein QOG39_1803, partial [Acidimicrobiaceae bacterium]